MHSSKYTYSTNDRPFRLSRLSTEIPNTVMTMKFMGGDKHHTFSLLPPSTTQAWEMTHIIHDNKYAVELHIVDPRGRSALVYIGRFHSELRFRGTVENGHGALATTNGGSGAGGRTPSFVRCVGFHLRADGRLSFQALSNFCWKGPDGSEADEVLIVLPAFVPVLDAVLPPPPLYTE